MTCNLLIKRSNMTYKNMFIISIFTFTLAVILTIPVTSAKSKPFDTRIALAKNQPMPLVIGEKKTEITSGIAKADMDRLNQSPDPEIIKSYIKTIAPEYGIDWKLVYAIGYHESGNYRSNLAQSNNNYFGRKATSGGYANWSTPEEGLKDQCRYIRERYYDRGMNTPASINPVYAEDMSWCIAVSSVMNTL